MALQDIKVNGVKVGRVTGTPDIVGLRSAKGEAGNLRIHDQADVDLVIEDVDLKRVKMAPALGIELSTATITGATLVLTYAEDLSEDSVPDADDYVVTVAGVVRAVTAVVVDGAAGTVTLTIAVAATAGQVVDIDYTPDPENLLYDVAEDDVAPALYFTRVTNNT